MTAHPITLAVLASGSGTTLQNLIDLIAASKLNARIVLFIASRPGIRSVGKGSKRVQGAATRRRIEVGGCDPCFGKP